MWATLSFLCSLLLPVTAHSLSDGQSPSSGSHGLSLPFALAVDNSDLEPLSDLEKRWYGVDDHDAENVPSPYNFAWPVTCVDPKVQPVRYCYKNMRSAVNLKEVIDAAIARWSVAIEHTSLRIIPDPRCIDPERCICSDLPADARDALMITDKTRKSTGPSSNDPATIAADRAHDKACSTGATTGYEYIAPNEPDRPWRHRLDVCALDPYDREGTFQMAVVFVMHEFGHAIGLRHEHQRADRSEYLAFYWQNLRGSTEAMAVVLEDPLNLFRGPRSQDLDARARMRFVSSNYPWSQYNPTLADFIPEDRRQNEIGQAKVNSFKYSNDFDYDSIMIYGDMQGSANKKTVFKRKDPKTGQIIEGRIFQGGMSSARDWENARPSEGDAARIEQLYDAHTEECEAQKKGTRDWAVKYKVQAGSSQEMVVFGPTKRQARFERGNLRP